MFSPARIGRNTPALMATLPNELAMFTPGTEWPDRLERALTMAIGITPKAYKAGVRPFRVSDREVIVDSGRWPFHYGAPAHQKLLDPEVLLSQVTVDQLHEELVKEGFAFSQSGETVRRHSDNSIAWADPSATGAAWLGHAVDLVTEKDYGVPVDDLNKIFSKAVGLTDGAISAGFRVALSMPQHDRLSLLKNDRWPFQRGKRLEPALEAPWAASHVSPLVLRRYASEFGPDHVRAIGDLLEDLQPRMKPPTPWDRSTFGPPAGRTDQGLLNELLDNVRSTRGGWYRSSSSGGGTIKAHVYCASQDDIDLALERMLPVLKKGIAFKVKAPAGVSDINHEAIDDASHKGIVFYLTPNGKEQQQVEEIATLLGDDYRHGDKTLSGDHAFGNGVFTRVEMDIMGHQVVAEGDPGPLVLTPLALSRSADRSPGLS